ncbi:hypothetical protein ABBQ38_007009 [Trebouxia sp. C0009 RCD-2024]
MWTLQSLFILLNAFCVAAVNAQGCSGLAPVLLQASWAAQLGWAASFDVSGWTGVTCNSTTGSLSIELSNRNLSGSLPDAWSAASQLSQLNISNNKLTGTLPNVWGNFNQLLSLDVGVNNITGTLPSSWANMTQLQVLGLSTNQLVGSLPEAWSNLTNLAGLNLGSNRLKGALPDSWSGFASVSHCCDLITITVYIK